MEDTEKDIEPQEELRRLTAAVPAAVSLFAELSAKNRQKLLTSIAAIFGLQPSTPGGRSSTMDLAGSVMPEIGGRGHFTEDRSISPKDFMMQKQPRTDVERVACLAYYLTHYREMPHFKTLDISKLNTDAAQMKFSNAAKAVDNATWQGYLAPATRGNKQLSAAGEVFVRLLPDRDAARAAMANARPRRKAKKLATKESLQDDTGTE